MTSIDDRRSNAASQVQNSQPLVQPAPLTRALIDSLPDIRGAHIDYGEIATAMSMSPDQAREARFGEALDQTRDAFMGPYSVGGKTVFAQPQFRMKEGYEAAHGTFQVTAKGDFVADPTKTVDGFHRALTAKGRQLVGILARAGEPNPGGAMLGYPSPRQLVRATQALIDAGKLPSLPPPATTSDCIRKMQWDWGIGIDCVDWCMNGLARVTGRSVESMGLQRGTDPFGTTGETTPRGFARVGATSARAGDIVTLYNPNDPPGHRVIVRDRSVVTANDPKAREVVARWGATASDFFRGSGPFRIMHVDSSWGAEDGKAFGGYRRDTWVFDEGSKSWMSYSPHSGEVGVHVSGAGPAGEALEGVYRWSGS
ncbi:MAG TPA: hypothetical protein VGH28_06310 [Polyangiaceae bacterium]